MRVKWGRVVLLDYMVRVGSGQVVETSAGKSPIEYLHGAGQILPALERALEGLREGEQAAFSIAAEDAYGERNARASGGQSYPITVKEVKQDVVLIDLNHPLAGERLFFEVNIRGVRPAGNQEIFAGKASEVEVV